MSFSAKDVANLRQQTGAGMMECKNALKEADGDIAKASELLRQKGLAAAAKKSEKATAEGIVASKIADDKKSAVIIELNTQTDFVAKNELFIELSKKVLDLILDKKPKTVDELLKLQIGSEAVSDQIAACVAKTGENIQIKRFKTFELTSSGVIGTYIHPVGNKIGVLLKMESNNDKPELEQIAKDISMHIAAAQPQPEFITKDEIPANIIEEEKRIELGKEDLADKPKEIAEKIVQGRLNKVLAQRCLIDQPYIKDPNLTIEKFIKEKSSELGIELKVAEFVRFNVGENSDSNSSEEEKSAVGV